MNIHEIARRAKVSVSTVSRAVNHVSTVNPELARRVWRAIEEVGYFPSTQARALVSGRSRMLGLIVSDITNPFFPELIRGFEDVAVPAGFEVLLSSTNYEPEKMASSVRRMLERKVEGVAIMTSEMEASLIGQLTSHGVPLVSLDLGLSGPHVANIQINYVSGLQQAIRHLIRQGHSRIAFVSGPQHLKSARVRREAFLACLRRNKVALLPGLVIESDHSMEGGYQATSKLLSAGKTPTAILASNDLTAIGLLAGLDRERLQVPEDVSVVGFDDIQFAQFTRPPLTTVRLPRAQLARHAFEALRAEIGGSGERRGTGEYVVETKLIVRGSTGPVGRKRWG